MRGTKKFVIILLSLIAISIITFLIPIRDSIAADTNITSGLSKNTALDIQEKSPLEIINQLGFQNRISDSYKKEIINKSNNFFIDNGNIGDTVKLMLPTGRNGNVLASIEWLNCYEKKDLIGEGNYVIEKVVCIKNREATTVRYWCPYKVYSDKNGKNVLNGGNLISTESGSTEGINVRARYKGYEPIYKEDGGIVYRRTTNNSKTNAMLAYLLSATDNNNYGNSYERYKFESARQNALWKLEVQGQKPYSNVGDNLYAEADRFAEYRANNQQPTLTRGSVSVVYSNDYVKIGPFSTSFNLEFGNLKSTSITYNDNETLNDSQFSFINNAGNNINELTSGATFYIKISNNTIKANGITKINKLNATFNDTNAYALYYFIIQDDIKDIQNLILTYQAGRYNTDINKSVNDLNINLVPSLDLQLKKVDSKDNVLSGINFKAEYIQSGTVVDTKNAQSNASGVVRFGNVNLLGTADVKVKVTEVSTPVGYKPISSFELTFRYTNGMWIVQKNNAVDIINPGSDNGSVSTVLVKVVNKSLIEKITINKTDSISGEKVAGAEFKVKLENVKSAKGYSTSGNAATINIPSIKTNASGQIVIEDIEIADLNKDVVITFEETKAAIGYKKLDGPVVLTLRRNGTGYTKVDGKTGTKASAAEFSGTVGQNVSKHEFSLNIKNIPIMNLGGIAWEDTQTGIKDVKPPNGRFDNEEKGIAGIPVQLYKGNGQRVTTDKYGNKLMTKTAKAGETVKYKLYNGNTETITLKAGEYIFPNLERGTDYYVEFTYDGINYKTVNVSNNKYSITNPKESKVEEVGREGFNAKFGTISNSGKADTKDTSYATATTLGKDLEYNKAGEENGVVISKLKTRDNNGNVLPDYQMRAKSVKYLQKASDWKGTWTSDGKINRGSYALDINCGLTYRFFDLALGMDIEEARLTINGKETKYGYNQILDGELSDLELDQISKDKAEEEGIIYNLYLYYSDYYYRISDYIVEGGIENKNKAEDGVNDEEIIRNNAGEELRAFVTYKVIIKNQSTINSAKVNEIAYYYDQNYEINKITDAEGNELYNRNGTNNDITFREDNTIGTIEGKKVARVSGFGTELNKDRDYRQELYFEFEVKKDNNGSLPKEIVENTEGLRCANVVEILSYSTKEGLVDNDSCPGNVVAIGYEDDTDEAQGINIKVKDETRKITGTVWKDGNKNGVIDEGEEAINDAIVQLIEVKPIKTTNNQAKYYEYIWQETRSGSNEVKTTGRNGYPGEGYENEGIGTGQYEFKNYIPGNYIIRFIYGDGTVEEYKTEEYLKNVKAYNGQDYQSTIDNNYKASWYNTAGYSGRQSVARDNEARRLEVMSYSAMIDERKGKALEEKTDDMLTNTWMAAETSRINVPVDTENINTTNDSTEVSFNYDRIVKELENMNLGLIKRPETKLILEKHITGLKITPNGTGVQSIIDAKANIDEIVNDGTITTTGVKEGLAPIKSERNNRGFWKVETDVEELAQGAKLEVEYTYVIRNDSEEDYLSAALLQAYQDGIGKDDKNEKLEERTNGKDDYVDYLLNKKGELKRTMRSGGYAYSDNNAIGSYLGKYYYTGEKANTDKPVTSRVEQLEEAINKDLKYDSATSGESFQKVNSTNENRSYINTDGNFVKDGKEIETVIGSTGSSKFLQRRNNPTDRYVEHNEESTVDYSKTVKLTTVLSSVTNGEIGGNYPSYMAEIASYSNAAGRRDMIAEPGNLSYVHSEDKNVTLDNATKYEDENGQIFVYVDGEARGIPEGAIREDKLNEQDEFWGETIIIGKPTGEDKASPLQIGMIVAGSLAVLGVGIILIKRYVLKK